MITDILLFVYRNACIYCYWQDEAARDFIGMIGALIAFGFAVFKYSEYKENEQNEFVKIGISAIIKDKEDKKWLIIKTKLFNNYNDKKIIEHSFLLINTTEEELDQNDKIVTIWKNFYDERTKLSCGFEYSDDFVKLKDLSNTNPIVVDNNKAYIPLPFYYSENARIASEELTYSIALELEERNSKESKSEPYNIRFFVFSAKKHRHRSTQTVIVLPKQYCLKNRDGVNSNKPNHKIN